MSVFFNKLNYQSTVKLIALLTFYKGLLYENAALWVVFWGFDHAVYLQGMKGKIDEYSDSDDDQHDAYLERMKAEGKIREEGNDSDESDSGSGEFKVSVCMRLYIHGEFRPAGLIRPFLSCFTL